MWLKKSSSMDLTKGLGTPYEFMFSTGLSVTTAYICGYTTSWCQTVCKQTTICYLWWIIIRLILSTVYTKMVILLAPRIADMIIHCFNIEKKVPSMGKALIFAKNKCLTFFSIKPCLKKHFIWDVLYLNIKIILSLLQIHTYKYLPSS